MADLDQILALELIKNHLLGDFSPKAKSLFTPLSGSSSNFTQNQWSPEVNSDDHSKSQSASISSQSSSSIEISDYLDSSDLFEFEFNLTDFPDFKTKPQVIDFTTPKSTNLSSQSTRLLVLHPQQRVCVLKYSPELIRVPFQKLDSHEDLVEVV